MKNKIQEMFNIFFELVGKLQTETLINLLESNLNDGIIFCGVGKNYYIAEKLAKTSISLGIQSQVLDPVHALHGDMGIVKNQIIIFISKSGTTKELVNLIQYISSLKDSGLIRPYLVGVFLNKNNKIQELLDLCIYTDEEEIYEFDEKNLIPTLSINILQMYLDYVIIKVFERNGSLMSRFKFNHPAGNIGKIVDTAKLL